MPAVLTRDHPDCRDNDFIAAEAAGIKHSHILDPLNIFQNTPPQPDGSFLYGVAMSVAGDHVAFCAERDGIVIVTACSSEPIDAGRSTSLRLEIFKGTWPLTTDLDGAGDSAVDTDVLTCDVTTAIGGEERDRRRNFVNLSVA
ncbi:MAG: DUF1989 domain-containing protein [Rhodospirillales bacterium]|nr:DUF1989 domain-containing protein [Rhodospirillales bacterium]